MAFYSTDVHTDDVTPTPVAARRVPKPTLYRTYGKRAVDLALVITSAPFTLPVIIALGLCVLLTGQSPLYIQERIGLNGRKFRMYKLRTMLPMAAERLEAYLSENPEARAEWDSKQKLVHDPRVTPIGNWLRKTSLDELPQLFNVLNGTMSIVGPRPMMPDQEDHYHGQAYYRLRPGMTGLWQVSDRNDCAFVGRVRFDEAYDQMVSLTIDARVIAQTVMVVLRGTGV